MWLSRSRWAENKSVVSTYTGSWLTSFVVQPRITWPKTGTAHSGLYLTTSANQYNLSWTYPIPKLRYALQMTLNGWSLYPGNAEEFMSSPYMLVLFNLSTLRFIVYIDEDDWPCFFLKRAENFITDGYKKPCYFWELISGPLEEQAVL